MILSREIFKLTFIDHACDLKKNTIVRCYNRMLFVLFVPTFVKCGNTVFQTHKHALIVYSLIIMAFF